MGELLLMLANNGGWIYYLKYFVLDAPLHEYDINVERQTPPSILPLNVIFFDIVA